MKLSFVTKKASVMLICTVLNITILIMSIIMCILALMQYKIGNLEYLFATIIIVLQLISFALTYVLGNFFEKQILGDSKKNLLKNINPNYGNMSLESSRGELRDGLNILVGVTILISIFLCWYAESFSLIIFSVSIICLAYMYADYIPHTSRYSKLYDSQFIQRTEKSNSLRGLARIYYKEFLAGKLGKKDNSINICENDFRNNDTVRDECIKNILYMQADYIKIPNTVFDILLIFINIFLVIPRVTEVFAQEVIYDIPFDASIIRTLLVVAINVVFAFINYYFLVTCENKCNEIKEIAKALQGSWKDRLEEYKKLDESWGNQFRIVRSRGIFVFNSNYFNDKEKFEKIPLQYRMQFKHRLYTHIPRLWTTLLLVILATCSIMITFKFEYWMIITMLIVECFLFIIVRFAFLPNYKKKKIEWYCRTFIQKS